MGQRYEPPIQEETAEPDPTLGDFTGFQPQTPAVPSLFPLSMVLQVRLPHPWYLGAPQGLKQPPADLEKG